MHKTVETNAKFYYILEKFIFLQTFGQVYGHGYECTLTVVGYYTSGPGAEAIYVPYAVADRARARMEIGVRINSASATLKNNDDLEAFRKDAAKFFADPDVDATLGLSFDCSLKIDTEALEKAETMLHNSIIVNRISTYLVFVLSAGAGFFLGFLMIRSRKQEIILMRALGRSNVGIYLDFSAEQILRVLLGTAVGGALFLWQPLSRLGIFLLVYFAGLTVSLIVFLNSKLITNTKEDE